MVCRAALERMAVRVKAEGTVKELSLGMNNAEYILVLLRKCQRTASL